MFHDLWKLKPGIVLCIPAQSILYKILFSLNSICSSVIIGMVLEKFIFHLHVKNAKEVSISSKIPDTLFAVIEQYQPA